MPTKGIIQDEEWRPVAGYEGRFSIHVDGRVRNDRTGRSIPQHVGARGAAQVSLFDGKRPHTFGVHRLLALTFMPRDDVARRKLQVHHKNGVVTDNRLENLEWVTPLGHVALTKSLGQYSHGERHRLARLNDEKVREIRRRAARGEKAKVMAPDFGVSPATVTQVINGITWRHVT